MAYDIDVLVIYSDLDDQQEDGMQGWVTNFKKFLEMMLVQVLGNTPNVLLKSEHDTITGGNLKKVAVMVPILSQNFMKSGECLDTLEGFSSTIKKDLGSRIFKVHKTPLSLEEQPQKLKALLGYDLYEINDDSGEVEEIVDFFSPEAERSYWMKMVDLAYDIHESLIVLKKLEKVSEIKSLSDRRSIYLAETGHDLSVQRNIIKRELQRHGYKVLPDHTLPEEVNELTTVINKELDECDLTIHLIGSSYGDIPQGTDRSVVDIQNQLAAEKSVSLKGKRKFSRLIWISNQLNHASEKQLAFIDNVKRDTTSSEGTEILQTALEDFKNIIREELIEVGIDKKFGRQTDSGSNGKPSIYVLHDKLDSKAVEPLKNQIKSAGFEILTPVFDGELLELRQKHINNLRSFDAAVIFQEKVNNQWVRMKLLDLLKAPGFGRRKAIKGKAIVSNREDKLDISAYKNYNVTLIEGNEKEAKESLKGFLEELN